MARNVNLCYLAEVGNNAKPLFNSLNGFVSQKQSNKEKKNKFSIFSETLLVCKRTSWAGLLVNEDISTENILSFIKKILELQYLIKFTGKAHLLPWLHMLS